MKFSDKVSIGLYTISNETPVFIIAEAGVNHNGNMQLAKDLIDVAVEAQADAVKFQTFKAEHLILNSVEKAPYQKQTTNKDETQFDMLKKLEVSIDQNKELLDYCTEKGIIFLTTPFDEQSLDELDSLNLSAYKVASTDLTNLPFLRKIAIKNKPIILSTGMSYFSEVQMALEEIYPFNKNVILLQCTANYPIADCEANLNVILTYKKAFDILVGYSDHSVGIGAAPYAVPLGAKVIEKHFTIDKSVEGPDHKASLTPNELKDFVRQIRQVEEYMGSKIKKPSLDEIYTRKSLQKCLVATRNIPKGQFIMENDIVAKRTGGKGLSPIYYKILINKRASKSYKINDLFDE
ncbi:MAG: N-acetylneuraminate synthase [Saprospiraceae bacterium]|nr:N-acetylneuraminate synthase [Saprospiraceae bacterium]